MNVAQYTKLLYGGGTPYINSDLMRLPNTSKSIEERALDSVCPPTKLNPNYKPNLKFRRSGVVPQQQQQQQQPQQRQQRPSVDASVLKHIYGGRN
jgi:hypothetical protein